MGFSFLNPDSGLYEIPFLDRMGFVFVFVTSIMIVLSLMAPKNNSKGLEIDSAMF